MRKKRKVKSLWLKASLIVCFHVQISTDLPLAFLFLAALKYLSRGHKFHITLCMLFSSETFSYCSSSLSYSSPRCLLNIMASVFPSAITECTECIFLACREYSVWGHGGIPCLWLVAVRSEVCPVQTLYCLHFCLLGVWHWLNFWRDQHILSICKAWFPQDHGPNISDVVALTAVELPRKSSRVACVKAHTAEPFKASLHVIQWHM